MELLCACPVVRLSGTVRHFGYENPQNVPQSNEENVSERSGDEHDGRNDGV